MSKKEFLIRIAFVAGAVLILALLITLVITANKPTEPTVEAPFVPTVSRDEAMNILVAGADRTSGLHDVLMLVHIDTSVPCVTVLQIPRDTYAAYTDGSYRKLNGAAKALGGMDALCSFMSQTLGVEIHRYVSLEADALAAVVNAIGGVTITLPDALHYEDPAQSLSIHLPAGRQTLDGKTAEYFVRYRMGYVRGDLGRMDAQKLFLAALASSLRDSLDLPSAVRLASAVLPRTKTNLSVTELTRLVRAAFAIDDEQVTLLTIPGEEVIATQSGASYYAVSAPAAAEVLVHYFGTPMGGFDRERMLRNARYPSFCEIYDTYRPYVAYSMGQIADEGIEIEKTQG